MQEENSNYLGFGCFFFFVVIIILVCSIILYNEQKFKIKTTDSNNSEVILNEQIKKDKSKDFIYFSLEENISNQLSATLKKANININNKDADSINNVLSKIYDEALLSVKKSNEIENICENGSDIYSYNSLDYAFYYGDFITLLVSENNYNCTKEIEIPYKIQAYTFDSVTGKLKTFSDLLNNYNITYTEILEKLKNNLEEQQTIINEVSNIKITETLNELKENENYAIYLSENKKLVMKYIVKTNTVDYNDIIELN